MIVTVVPPGPDAGVQDVHALLGCMHVSAADAAAADGSVDSSGTGNVSAEMAIATADRRTGLARLAEHLGMSKSPAVRLSRSQPDQACPSIASGSPLAVRPKPGQTHDCCGAGEWEKPGKTRPFDNVA